jgi:hypothetical protein
MGHVENFDKGPFSLKTEENLYDTTDEVPNKCT